MDLSAEDFPEKLDRMRLSRLYEENASEEEDTLHFWRRVISAYCKSLQSFEFNVHSLEPAFTIDGMTPLSLPKCLLKLRVIDFIPIENLNRSAIINYSLYTFSSTVSHYLFNIHSNKLLCIPLLHEMKDLILKYSQTLSNKEKIYALDSKEYDENISFQSYLHTIGRSISPTTSTSTMLSQLDERNTQILVTFLLSQKAVSIHSNSNLLKISSTPISELEVASFRLKYTITSIEDLLAVYHEKLDLLNTQLRNKIRVLE